MESLAPPGTEDNVSSTTSSFVSKKNSETDRLLSLRYPLANGGTSNVFELTWQNGSEVWYCRVCRCPVMGQVFNHEAGKRHTALLETATRNAQRTATSSSGNNLKNQISPEGSSLGSSKAQIDWEDVNAMKLEKEREIEVTVAPGEPVPPGFEGEITKVAQIQERLDNFKTSSLIGLEYLLELQDYDQDREPSYLCLLCGKKGDFRTIIPHLVSYNHLQSYLHRHYPKTHAALVPFSTHRKYKKCWQETVTKIADAIENKYGRMLPHPIDVETYERNKKDVYNKVMKGPHFSEGNGCSFEHLVDKDEIIRVSNEASLEEMQNERRLNSNASNSNPTNPNSTRERETDKDTRARRNRRSLSSVSSISSDDFDTPIVERKSSNSKPSSSLYNRRRRSRTRSRSRSPYYKRRVNTSSTSTLPWNRPEYRRQENSKERSREKDRSNERGETKKEEFRRLSSAIESDMERQLRQHQLNPEKHPQYNEEWKVFWNKRYKELQSEGKDTQGYDFKPEWIIYWNKKMEEFHKAEVKAKIDALRRRLGLPEIVPISFKINSSSTTSSVLRRRDPKPLACQPVAAQPDQDHEVIIIDDSRDETRRKPRDRDGSHSPWESDNGNSPRKDFRRRQTSGRRSRNTRSKSRSRSVSPNDSRRGRYMRRRTRSRSRSRSKSRRYNRRSRTRSKSPQIRRDIDKSQGASRHSDDPWDRAVSFKPRQQESSPIPFKHSKDVIMVRESTLKKQALLDEQLTAVEDLGKDVNIVAVLRLLTALEDKLGSLGPKVVDLLANALLLEKKDPNSSEKLLDDESNCVMFETIKEKLKGLLHAGLVTGYSSQEKAIQTSITKIAGLLHIAGKRKTEKEAQRASIIKVDKAAIAQQIANALVLQGKTDVTQAQLEQLISTVVSIAAASKDKDKPITTASFLEMLKQNKDQKEETTKDSSKIDVFNEPHKKEAEVAKDKEKDAMDGLSDLELQTLLQSFKDLSAEEQHGLISYLKKLEAKEPARVETLRKFVNLETATGTSINSNASFSNKRVEDTPNEGRISPFSKKLSESTNLKDKVLDTIKLDTKPISDDDEDYSYEDVFKAASKNLTEQKTDVSSLIANIMVSIASNTKGNNSGATTTLAAGNSSNSFTGATQQNSQLMNSQSLQLSQQRSQFSNMAGNINLQRQQQQQQQQQPFRQFPSNNMQQGNIRPLMTQNNNMPNMNQSNMQNRPNTQCMFYPKNNNGNNDNYNNYFNRW